MNQKTKAIFRNWLHPVILNLILKFKGSGVYFHGNFSNWQKASDLCQGYDDEKILANVLASTLKVKNGEAVYERDSVLFDHIEYAWPVTAALMWVAARSSGRLNVLDFGGSLGSSYFQNRKFLQTIPELVWNVIEQPHYVEAGHSYIEDEHLHFYKNIDDCLKENNSNVVLLSSVLQYLQEPFEILDRLLSSKIDTLIIDRTSYLKSSKVGLIKIQHVPENIYKASYPCHFFIEKDVVNHIENFGYKLIEEFESPDELDPSAYWKGHIYLRTSDG